jgi:hypothetical protein
MGVGEPSAFEHAARAALLTRGPNRLPSTVRAITSRMSQLFLRFVPVTPPSSFGSYTGVTGFGESSERMGVGEPSAFEHAARAALLTRGLFSALRFSCTIASKRICPTHDANLVTVNLGCET